MRFFFGCTSSSFFYRTLNLSAWFILLFGVVPASAQNYAAPRAITVRQGLPQGFVAGIVQDENDFIWLGTRDGLARYDGREFKVFRANDGRGTSLSTNVITALYLDGRNRIWILHESMAVDVFDPVSEKFSCFTCDPVNEVIRQQLSANFAYVDPHDNLWLINPGHGFWKSDLKNNTLTRITKSTSGLLTDTVRGVIEAPGKQHWVFTNRGMQLLDEHDRATKNVPFDFPALNGISDNISVVSKTPVGLTYLHDDLILVRDWDIAFLFDTKRLTVTAVIDRQGETFLPNTTGPQKDPSGNAIIEVMGSLYQVDQHQGVKKIWDGKMEVISFYVDRSGVAWLGNGASGLLTIDLRSAVFRSQPYATGFVGDVLRQYGVTIPKACWLNHSPQHRYGFDSQTRFAYDSKNRLWLTQGPSTLVYDAGEKTFTQLPLIPTDKPTYDILPATLDNDTCWHLDGGNPVYYDAQRSSWTYPLGKDWKLPKYVIVLDMVKIGNTLWGTTSFEGLLRIDLPTGRVSWYRQETGQLPTNELLDIERDLRNDSLVWIGTRSGLVHFNVLRGTSETLTVKDGLPNNTIYCVVAGPGNFLWLSTNKGLCRLDPASLRVLNFSDDDGLQGDEFNQFHKLKLPDGQIAFGGTGGSTVFDPTQIRDDIFQPKVQLTRLRIHNVEIEPARDSGVVATSLNSISSLKLKHDQNFLTFYFAGLQFNNVGKILYRYRLKGFDDDWNYNALGIATYTKIPPGDYELELNATNTAGAWSEHVKILPIVIDPPFWKTNLAYAFYALLFVAALLLYIRYTIKKIRLEDLVELKKKEAEHLKQLDEAKSRFFANITHEFRTPLTLIISPLEQLLKNDGLNESQKKHLQTIQQNSHQLLQFINQILELSKLEVGLLKISATPVHLNTFLERIVMPFQSMADHKQLALHFESALDDDAYFTDEDKLERIVNNLLANAIKFTPKDGSVTLKVSRASRGASSDVITLNIIDTGIGISPDALPYIFDRFYQVDDRSDRAYEGTGIGLSLVKELTQLLEGTLTVESTLGSGATFTVALPLTRVTGAHAEAMREPEINATPGRVMASGNAPAPGNADKPLVLVAEDNDSLRDFLTGQLSNFYSVIAAANGKEAWEKVAGELPELIVTDVMMPYMDGLSLAKKVRETEATSHIGLIMLTAKASVESRLEGLQTGANDYLSKPFSVDELQLRIANLLAHQKKQREYFYHQLLRNEGSRAKEVENEFLKKAYQFLDLALASETPIGVEDLADHLSMSSRTLNRKLSVLLGLTANEFIRNHRLAQATTLLKKGLAISEVAYQAGFESPQYFAQCFKALYNVTPTEYQKQYQEKWQENSRFPASPA